MKLDTLTPEQLARLAVLLKQAGYTEPKRRFKRKRREYNWYSVWDKSHCLTGTVTDAREWCKANTRWKGITNLVPVPI